MAQPVFDLHPLEQYLREVGEAIDIMPGGSAEFCIEHHNEPGFQEADESDDPQWLPMFLLGSLDMLYSVLSVARKPSPFVERFKYDVISSSLLSSELATPLLHLRHQTSYNVPGRLSSGHSRGPSTEGSVFLEKTSFVDQRLIHTPFAAELRYWFTTLAFVAIAAVWSIGYYIPAFLAFGGTLYCLQYGNLEIAPKLAMTSSLDTLHDLIAAGDVWDSVVREVMSMLESEERRIFYSPVNLSSPIRVALQSSLHTSQTQCDNIRQLFSALTSPSELAQISEMYAPHSPMASGFSSPDPYDNPRPLSLPVSRDLSSSSPSRNKRSTWNGSYSALASAGSPTRQVLKRREKRRSDLTSLLELASSMRSSVSAPVTPQHASSLTGVQEEDNPHPDPNLSPSSEGSGPQFGVEALGLQRKRKASGMEALGLSPRYSYRSSIATHTHGSSVSRFTTLQTTRHPLSLSALDNAVQGASASKRFACSHLLALRFNEEDDEGYWEDVRSVMGLLTSTLVDASSRLTEALEEAEKQKLRDQTPSLPSHSRNPSSSFSIDEEALRSRRPQMIEQMVSFAPMPSHLSRFAAHVDTISSALNDAREHLGQCVASLREYPSDPDPPRSSSPDSLREPAPLQAYECMRRELGLALRECERGRERLLHILAPARHMEDSDSADDVPALGHDAGSDESDKPDFPPDDHGPGPIGYTVAPQEGEAEIDIATSHLLLTASSQHLPPPGIEQVFEADSGAEGMFTRERSKLTREERIKMIKARRQSGGVGLGISFGSSGPPGLGPGMERWGPGGDVVQELKDVIWKVGERRRRMVDSQSVETT